MNWDKLVDYGATGLLIALILSPFLWVAAFASGDVAAIVWTIVYACVYAVPIALIVGGVVVETIKEELER